MTASFVYYYQSRVCDRWKLVRTSLSLRCFPLLRGSRKCYKQTYFVQGHGARHRVMFAADEAMLILVGDRPIHALTPTKKLCTMMVSCFKKDFNERKINHSTHSSQRPFFDWRHFHQVHTSSGPIPESATVLSRFLSWRYTSLKNIYEAIHFPIQCWYWAGFWVGDTLHSKTRIGAIPAVASKMILRAGRPTDRQTIVKIH